MSEKSVTELDVVFISYDEPNADMNWAKLLETVPWAKRVHGVEGSDSAHKAAARLSETDRFISVDADNTVDPKFFDQMINFDHEKFKNKVISWSAKNVINGLEYGNGGLKCWPVDYVLNMKTHENAEDKRNQIDFCWEDTYVQMNNRFCLTHQNGSPMQAFRSGFREGVKMSLDRGEKVDPYLIEEKIWWGNYHRLLIWMSVGADVDNGLWAIYGARLGFWMTNMSDWDYVNVRDFKWLNTFWDSEVAGRFIGTDTRCLATGYRWSKDLLLNETIKLGDQIRKKLGVPVADLDADASKFFKKTYIGLPRTGSYITEAELNELRQLNQ